MSRDYFYTLPPCPPTVGYEYNKNSELEAVGYFTLVNDTTILTVPESSRDLVNQLVNIDTADVMLEYDLNQATPAIFKTLLFPNTHNRNVDLMWQVSGLTPHPLPTLPAGTRYTHIGAFINRPGAGLRLNVSGGGHYVKQFILEHGGDPHWFDTYEHYHARYIASCDYVDGAVTNIRLEIHRGIDGKEVPELSNDPWVKQTLQHCTENIQKNYSNNLPKVIISHYKVGANTHDIANGYMKMYTQAHWNS